MFITYYQLKNNKKVKPEPEEFEDDEFKDDKNALDDHFCCPLDKWEGKEVLTNSQNEDKCPHYGFHLNI